MTMTSTTRGTGPRTNSPLLRVQAVNAEAEGIVSVELVAPDGGRLVDWTPGSHIDLVLPNGHVRQYSLCGDRFDPHRYRIAVRLDAQGRGGSAWIHRELEVGRSLSVGGPRNTFPLVPADEYVFVAGGIGITPLLPMITQAELVGVPWRLLYAGHRADGMAFAGQLASFGERVRIVAGDRDRRADLGGFVGDRRPGLRVYGCGPARMLAALEQHCTTWPRGVLRTERFSGSARADAAPEAAIDVHLNRSGRDLLVPPDRSILDVLNEAGIEVLSSCRHGVCGTCETTVLEGVPDHRDSLSEEDGQDSTRSLYVCVSRARGRRLVLDL